MVRKILAVFIPFLLLMSISIYLSKKNNLKNENRLVVYTYSSFVSSWGPGPELKKLFEEKTSIAVDFIDVGEAGIIIQRLMLEKNKTKADMVLGLDQFQLQEPEIQSLFEPQIKMNLNIDEFAPAQKIQISPFIAYNWSPMTFIYRKSDNNTLPEKLADLVSEKFKGKIILMDPRTSSPGFIFFNWVVQKLGDKGTLEFFQKIKKHIYSVTPSWSAAYGLFKKKQAKLVFSYLTSPVYHWVEEKDLDYMPLYLNEDLPYHIEYAAVLKSSPNKPATKQFLEFLLEPAAQKILMQKNYMLPVIAGVREGTEFEKLKKINLFESPNPTSREEVLKIWKEIQW